MHVKDASIIIPTCTFIISGKTPIFIELTTNIFIQHVRDVKVARDCVAQMDDISSLSGDTIVALISQTLLMTI